MSLLEKFQKNDGFGKNSSPPGPKTEKPKPKMSPCEKCGAPLFWRDVYGGGPHCAECNSWPSASMVREKIMVTPADDGEADVIDQQEWREYETQDGYAGQIRRGYEYLAGIHFEKSSMVVTRS